MLASGIVASVSLIGILMALSVASAVLIVVDKRYEADRHD